MANSSAVNLSLLPPPNLIEQLSFDDIVSAMLADFQARMTAAGATYTALVESDPAYKMMEVGAYREVMLRQTAQEYCLGLMLAFAKGPQLDQLGANVNVQRLTITPANPNTSPPTPAVMEEDPDYLARIQASFDGFTTAGSQASYVFHAKSADARVLDVQAVSPSPGVVDIYVLSNVGNGAAPADLLANVTAALNAQNIRPLNDQVNVMSAAIVDYQIDAVLTMYPGPDPTVVQAAAISALQAYTASVQRIGYTVSAAGIDGGLFQPGVSDVSRTSPAASLIMQTGQAGYCTSINVTVAQASSD